VQLHEDAPAKLNLYLHLRGRRGDGYHLLDSLVTFLSCSDRLEADSARQLSFMVTGPFASAVPHTDDNIVMRAAWMLYKQCKLNKGAAITLHKHLPVGAGLGGGSADAAACLRLLQRLWKVDVDPVALRVLAARLGSDVPGCLGRASCYMGGIGDKLSAAPALPAMHFVIVWPGAPLGTAEVYKAYDSGFVVADARLAANQGLNTTQLAELLALRRNDLEKPALRLLPVIGEALEALRAEYGCLLARMTGSGSACFGIFAAAAHARLARTQIAEAHPDWWVEEAKIHEA
jgi:4-diphosphocytidyl-2-C-methyl-D-erythritol kinase